MPQGFLPCSLSWSLGQQQSHYVAVLNLIYILAQLTCSTRQQSYQGDPSDLNVPSCCWLQSSRLSVYRVCQMPEWTIRLPVLPATPATRIYNMISMLRCGILIVYYAQIQFDVASPTLIAPYEIWHITILYTTAQLKRWWTRLGIWPQLLESGLITPTCTAKPKKERIH